MRLYRYILLASAALIAAACHKAEPEKTPVINIERQIVVPYQGEKGELSVNLFNSSGWNIEVSGSGCVSKADFNSSTSKIDYTVSENRSSSERFGEIAVLLWKGGCNDVVATVSVTQKARSSSGPDQDEGDDDDDEDDGDSDGDGDEDEDDEDDDDDDDDERPVVETTRGWYELPVIADKDGNGIDDTDKSLYYAYHSFKLNGRKMRNYAVCFSAEHHCAMWVSAPRHDCYVGGSGRSDAYRQDPDIPSSLQFKSKSAGKDTNKGHLLGSAERTCCREANEQVFYYSNIAPQYSSGFNTGGGGWNLLEDWIDSQVCADTLYEVVGCYYEKYTDGYGCTGTPAKITFGDRSDVSRPTMFYYVLLRTKKGNTHKALKDCKESELQCAAFVRSHSNSLKGKKVSSKEMMSVADLEKITGFTYFPNVPNAPKDSFKPSDWGL